MNRFPILAGLAVLGLMVGLSAGDARAQYPSCAPPAPAVIPFVGASYSLTSPGYSSYYQPGYPSYYAPDFTSYYQANYGGHLTYGSAYPNPGPYYYTATYPYSMSYYSYYYTPGWFRY